MFSEEQYATSLAKFLSDFDYAIVDTCSLMDDAFPKWMDILHGAKDYLNDDLRIIVPRECFEELKKHAKNKEDAGKRIAAKSAIKIIRRAKWSKLLEIGKKEGEKNFADHVIYVKASTDRLDKKILIITQDKKLATDLLHLNNLASQRGRRVRVCKIGVDGTLVPNHGEYPKQGEKLGNKPVLEREKKALFGNKKKPQEKPKKAESDNNEIVSADSKLQSTIPNGTYPIEKKIEDITHQINAMSKLSASSLSALKLTYDLPALQKLLSQLKSEKAKKEKDKTSPSPTEAKKQQPKPKAPAAEQPAKAEKPVQEQQKKEQPKKPDLGWYEKGSNLKAAITKVCEHHGVLVRDPGIAYDKQAHGEVDFTSKDVDHVSELLQNGISGGDVFQSTYRGWLVAGQKVSDGMFKVWINFKSKATEPAKKASKPAEPDKPEPKKEKPKKEQEPQLPEPSKPASKKKGAQPKQTTDPNPAAEQPKAPEPKGVQPRPIEPKSAAKPEKPAKPKKPAKPEKPANEAKKDEASASNAGAVLIVAEPAKKKPAKKAKPAAAKPVEEKPAAEKPKATKDVKPSEPKAKKPVPEKAKKEPEAKKATKAPKKVEKPAEAPAKQKPEPKKEVKPDAFALAQAADKRLKANITNPTYPNENKVKDIEAQIDLVKKLKPEERDELNYGLDALKAMLAMSK